MKKMTIRIEDNIYNRVCLISKETKTSANKIISKLVKDKIFENNDIDFMKNLLVKTIR